MKSGIQSHQDLDSSELWSLVWFELGSDSIDQLRGQWLNRSHPAPASLTNAGDPLGYQWARNETRIVSMTLHSRIGRFVGIVEILHDSRGPLHQSVRVLDIWVCELVSITAYYMRQSLSY